MAAAALVLAGLARAGAPIAGAGAQADRSRPIAPPPAPPPPPFDGLPAPQKHAPDPESGADGAVGPSVDGFRDGAVSPRRLDAGPSQLPPAPQPYPPTNRSRRLSHPGEGWYIGASGESCTQTCTGAGLLCTDKQLMVHNPEVNSRGEMLTKKTHLGFTGSSASICDHSTGSTAPYFQSSTCKYKKFASGKQRDKYDCGASTSGRYRLCYCHPPLPDGWFIGKGNANCDDTCADARLVCDVQKLKDKNNKADTRSRFNARITELGGDSVGDGCVDNGGSRATGWKGGMNGDAMPRYGSSSQSGSYRCLTKSSTSINHYSCSQGAGGPYWHRLCYCVQPQPSPPPPSPPPSPPPPSPPAAADLQTIFGVDFTRGGSGSTLQDGLAGLMNAYGSDGDGNVDTTSVLGDMISARGYTSNKKKKFQAVQLLCESLSGVRRKRKCKGPNNNCSPGKRKKCSLKPADLGIQDALSDSRLRNKARC